MVLPAGEMLSLASAPFGAATTALGILAGFRLNASYGRFEECRIFWGDTNNTIRDLARKAEHADLTQVGQGGSRDQGHMRQVFPPAERPTESQ